MTPSLRLPEQAQDGTAPHPQPLSTWEATPAEGTSVLASPPSADPPGGERGAGLEIRRAVPADTGALALVGAATFLESYCLDLPGPDIVAHCAKAHASSFYDEALTDPDQAFWVVEAGRTVVGYAMLAPSVLPEAREDDLELRRIYVLTRFQGGGTGRGLVEAAAAEARARGARRLTLGMYGENHAALAFYTRVGFVVIGKRTFTVGDQVCDDLVLGLDL